MNRTRIDLVGGGARSGKSRFALELSRGLGPRRAFVATAEAHDDEMRERICRHQRERGDAFRLVEAPLDLAEALEELDGVDVVLVDCLTLWLSNLLLAEDRAPERAVAELLSTLEAANGPKHIILVTNEVGFGLVPESALGRRFRDLAGGLHQKLATVADRVYLAALGVVLRLKPGPATPAIAEIEAAAAGEGR